ncbi:hypothetical protein R5M38_004127, partial [Salmonella enterica]|nr:hypothetical protein [Salmonella enterica]
MITNKNTSIRSVLVSKPSVFRIAAVAIGISLSFQGHADAVSDAIESMNDRMGNMDIRMGNLDVKDFQLENKTKKNADEIVQLSNNIAKVDVKYNDQIKAEQDARVQGNADTLADAKKHTDTTVAGSNARTDGL